MSSDLNGLEMSLQSSCWRWLDNRDKKTRAYSPLDLLMHMKSITYTINQTMQMRYGYAGFIFDSRLTKRLNHLTKPRCNGPYV